MRRVLPIPVLVLLAGVIAFAQAPAAGPRACRRPRPCPRRRPISTRSSRR